MPSSAAVSTTTSPARADRERERRAVAGVADRVLGQVLGDDPQHPRPERQVDVGVAVGARASTPARAARVVELVDDLLEHRQRVRAPERDDLLAALELREEEDLVDQRARVLDLGARLLDQRRATSAPGRSAESSSARIRASGVRSSCETAAVKPVRSSSKRAVRRSSASAASVAFVGLGRPSSKSASPDRHHPDTRSEPATGSIVGAWPRS